MRHLRTTIRVPRCGKGGVAGVAAFARYYNLIMGLAMKRLHPGIRCGSLFIACVWLSSAWAQNAAVTVNIDANAGRHPISSGIYGVADGTVAQLHW